MIQYTCLFAVKIWGQDFDLEKGHTTEKIIIFSWSTLQFLHTPVLEWLYLYIKIICIKNMYVSPEADRFGGVGISPQPEVRRMWNFELIFSYIHFQQQKNSSESEIVTPNFAKKWLTCCGTTFFRSKSGPRFWPQKGNPMERNIYCFY